MNTANSLDGICVLIIDDSNTIRFCGKLILSEAGCKVVVAEDGFDALVKIAECRPDLIIVDAIMPRLDGYQTCSLVKRHSKYRNIPVIMLSSLNSAFDRARGHKAGADGYLSKPFSKAALLRAAGTRGRYHQAA